MIRFGYDAGWFQSERKRVVPSTFTIDSPGVLMAPRTRRIEIYEAPMATAGGCPRPTATSSPTG